MEKCCKNCRHLTKNLDHVFVCLVLGKFLSLEFIPQIPDEAFSCNLFAIENKMQDYIESHDLYEIQVNDHDDETQREYYCMANSSDEAIMLVDEHIQSTGKNAEIESWEIKLPFFCQELICQELK